MWERGGRARWAEEPRPTAHIVSTSSRASISGGGSPNGQSIAQCSFYRTVHNYNPRSQVKTYKKVHVRIRRLSDRPVVLPATAAVGFWRETPINRYR